MSGIPEVLVFSLKNLQYSSHPNLRISWFWWNLELNHRRENPSISAPRAYGICSDLTWTIHTTRSHHHQLIGIGAIEIGTANWWPLKENTDQSSMKWIVQQALCCMLILLRCWGHKGTITAICSGANHVSELRIAHGISSISSNHNNFTTTKAQVFDPKKRWRKKKLRVFLTTKLFSTKVTLRWRHLSLKIRGLDPMVVVVAKKNNYIRVFP